MTALPNCSTDIANLALDQIGEPPIDSIENPTTTLEYLLARNYDLARLVIQRKWIWNFSKKQTTVYNTGTAPLFGWANAFTLPDDFVRFVQIHDPVLWWWHEGYDIQNDKQLLYPPLNSITGATANGTLTPSLMITYCADIREVDKWDAAFQNIVVLQLAANVCFKVTRSKSLTQQVNKLLAQAEPDAVSVTMQEQPMKRMQRSRAVRARRSYGTNYTTPGFYVDFGP